MKVHNSHRGHIVTPRWRRWLMLLIVVTISTSPPTLAQETDSLTVRYFEQLRKRRLFSVAEQLGADRLADARISPEDVIQVTVELSKTYAEHAKYTSGEEHDFYWQFAESVIEEALTKHGEHPRSLLLKVQQAFVPAARGTFLGGQLEMFPHDLALQKQTGAVFESAIERLKPVESELARRDRQSNASDIRQRNDLQTFEIHDLLSETRFRLAETLQEYSQTKPLYAPDRSRLIKEAYPWLKYLSEAGRGDDYMLPAKIRLAENHRLRDDLNGADALLVELEQDGVPEELQNDLVAERARWLIAKGRLSEAEKQLSEFRQKAQRASGELAFLEVQVLVYEWEQATKSQNQTSADAIRTKIESQAKTGQAGARGYWAYRIAMLSEQLEKSRKYGIEVAKVLSRAEAMYAAGQIDSALSDYKLAAEEAQKIGRPEIAFDLGYTRGSILIQQKEHSRAADEFRGLAANFPKNERAPDAKLLEAYCLGKIYEADPSSPARHEAYVNALKSHVETYADHVSAGDAYWMLGQHEEQRRQNTQALAYYREIPRGHRRGLAGQLGVARVYEKVLERHNVLESTAAHEDPKELARILESIKKSRLEWEEAAAAELGRFIAAYPAEPEPLGSGQADVALRLARMQLTRTTPEYRQADSLLERILVSGAQQQSASPPLAEDEKAEWSRILKTTRQLRIVSLAGQGLSRRAEMLVEELASSNTRDVLGVMDGLMQVARGADNNTRRKLGELQLQTALELNRRRSQLDPAEQNRLDHCRAQAYLATNQPAEAIKIYEAMLAARPKDSGLRQKIATLLTESENRQALLKAKELWRKEEARLKPGSTAWLEKRYQLASCSLKLGEKEECRKLIGVTKLLYHDPSKTDQKDLWLKFEKLLAEVD